MTAVTSLSPTAPSTRQAWCEWFAASGSVSSSPRTSTATSWCRGSGCWADRAAQPGLSDVAEGVLSAGAPAADFFVALPEVLLVVDFLVVVLDGVFLAVAFWPVVFSAADFFAAVPEEAFFAVVPEVAFLAVAFLAVVPAVDFLAVVADVVLFTGTDWATSARTGSRLFFLVASAGAGSVSPMKAPPAAMAAPKVRAGSCAAPEITSRSCALGRKSITTLADAWKSSPVLGLRTIRAGRTAFSNAPKPLMATFSPRATSRVMVSRTASRACPACFLLPSKWVAKASTSCLRFTEIPSPGKAGTCPLGEP